MQILLLGAGGFIGRHILSRLLMAGHQLTAVVRQTGALAEAFPQARFVERNLAQATLATEWLSLLAGVDVIVNAAGLLRGPDMRAVHVDMPVALLAAARQAGVKRVVLLSAISARPDVLTDYSQTKLAGEDVLRGSGVSWVILRPSLVYGEGSYGGTSLLRGLAGIPLLMPLPGTGEFHFSPIHVGDLAETVKLVCEDERFVSELLEPAGPETLSLRELLQRYRNWLGFGRVPFLPIPMPVMRLLGRVGDLTGDGPVSSNSLRQMVAGNGGDGTAFAHAIGFAPRSLTDALLAHPAQVQDRWHARLFFMAPLLKAVLVLMWLASALLGLWFGAAQTEAVVAGLGLPTGWADPLRIGSSLLDVGIAALLLLDRKARWSTPVQLAVVLGYTFVIGLAAPGLWLDPLGPLMKNIPMLLVIAVHGAIGDRR